MNKCIYFLIKNELFDFYFNFGRKREKITSMKGGGGFDIIVKQVRK